MSTITSTPINTVAASNTGAGSGAVDNAMIANNFQTFLTLLTTQLKNQNPLDPLDTNQFTQQLVQFAQVEQQMKSNDQLATLVALDKTAQSTAALAYVGSTVVVDGSTAPLVNGSASWTLNTSSPRPPPSPSGIRPVRPLIPAPSRSIRAARLSSGMAAATTAGFGRRAATRSPPPASMPTSSRSPFRPKCRPPWIRSTSRRSAAAVDQRPELHHGQDQAGSCVPATPPARQISSARICCRSLAAWRLFLGQQGQATFLLLIRSGRPHAAAHVDLPGPVTFPATPLANSSVQPHQTPRPEPPGSFV